MRVFDQEFAERLQADTTTLCIAWIVTRTDGLVMGFTEHDRDLEVDGVVCRAAAGVAPAQVEAVTGLAPDTSAFVGAVHDAAVTEADLHAGLWDRAEVRRLTVDWERPEFWVETFSGFFGEIRHRGEAFEVEIVGISDALAKRAGRVLKRQSDDDDATAGLSGSGTVVAVEEGVSLTVSGLEAFGEGYFGGGTVRFADGRSVRVFSDTGTTTRIILLDSVVEPVPEGGDAFEVEVDPARSFSVGATGGSLVDHTGFPHMPGEDWALSYAVRGGRHDGSSLFG